MSRSRGIIKPSITRRVAEGDRWDHNRANGKCFCGKPVGMRLDGTPATKCDDHLKQQRDSKRDRMHRAQAWKRANHICEATLACLSEVVPGTYQCGYHLERHQEIRESRIERGICPFCMEKLEPGRRACKAHLEAAVEASMAYQKRHKKGAA